MVTRVSVTPDGVVLSVVSDIPVNSEASVVTLSISRGFTGPVFDSETPVVTSSISPRFAGPVFEDAHRGRVCVRMFIGVSAPALCVSALYYVILKEN